jgi:hypothetical protein
LGCYDEALGQVQIALAGFRELSDLEGIADSLSETASVYYQLRRRGEAILLAKEALEIYRRLPPRNRFFIKEDIASPPRRNGRVFKSEKGRKFMMPDVRVTNLVKTLARWQKRK